MAAPEPTEPTLDLTGRTLGDYALLRKLGQGAMGQVYLAQQISLKRSVALKILRRDHSENPTALKRFQAEAEAVARLNHPNIVQVFAVGEHESVRYMVLEYVNGRNLRDYLARKGSPQLNLALLILKQVAAALQKASEVGLIHRDIKPENIMITRKGEVKVADFGLSRYDATEAKPLNLTQSGMTLGTPLYMSPEQVQGKVVDHRSDLYSFGVTAYQLLSGQTPFTGKTAFEVALQHVQAVPPSLAELRPDLPTDLCELVHKLLAKAPEERYATARDVIRDLTKIQKGLPLQLDMPSLLISQSMTAALPRLSEHSAGLSGSQTSIAQPRRPFRFRLWWLLLPSAAFVGWGFSEMLTPDVPTVAAPGLPEVRPPSPVVSYKERLLLTKIKDRASKPTELYDAALELALLYVNERRFDDLENLFKTVDYDRPTPLIKQQLQLVAKLCEGVALTYRDKSNEANELFTTTLEPRGRGVLLRQLESFLLSHPEFGEMLALALDYLAESIAPKKLPPHVDYLRSPGGFLRGLKN